jgi:hypothetical protein
MRAPAAAVRCGAMAAVLAAAAAGCARAPSDTERQLAAKQERAYHLTFDQIVPSIQAALALAARVDSAVSKNGSTFHSAAWFANAKPVALDISLVEAGDTTAVDHYYFQQGRLIAWTKRLHAPSRAGVHRLVLDVVVDPVDGMPLVVRGSRDGVAMPSSSGALQTVMRMSLDTESGLLGILREKARREKLL